MDSDVTTQPSMETPVTAVQSAADPVVTPSPAPAAAAAAKRKAKRPAALPSQASAAHEDIARMDRGELNRRILEKEQLRADFRRVEAAGIPRSTRLWSGEAKRLFARLFALYQQQAYFISSVGRLKLSEAVVEAVEEDQKQRLAEASEAIGKLIDQAGTLLRNAAIDTMATYMVEPLCMEVKITSPQSRRLFELIHKLDELMPLLQTLEIEEVITLKNGNRQRSEAKRIVRRIASTARETQVRIRQWMNEEDVKAAGNAVVAASRSGRHASPDAAATEDLAIDALPAADADDLLVEGDPPVPEPLSIVESQAT